MPKPIFNTAEMYLAQNWTDARLVERSLGAMRQAYKLKLEEVIGRVRKQVPELDHQGFVLDLDEDDDAQRGLITVGLGKKEWPSMSFRTEPTGIWLSGITLGQLIVDHADRPTANVFICPPRGTVDVKAVAKGLAVQAEQLCPGMGFQAESDEQAGWGGIGREMPEGRESFETFS